MLEQLFGLVSAKGYIGSRYNQHFCIVLSEKASQRCQKGQQASYQSLSQLNDLVYIRGARASHTSFKVGNLPDVLSASQSA